MKKRLCRGLSTLLLCALLLPCAVAPASALSFADVPANHWTAPAIQRCTDLGFFKGESSTVFGMGKDMTRAAFVVVLSRFFGWETSTVTASSYEDVPAKDWYAPAVEAALKNGAITLQTKQFRPEEPVTREEMAVMLARALGYDALAGLAQDLPNLFEDVTTNPGYIALSQEMELVTGTTATSFAPKRAATREEVAVTLIRLYDKLRAPAPGKVGIVTSGEDLPDLKDFEAVAVNGGQLIAMAGKAKLVSGMTAEESAPIRVAAKEAGAKQLLYASGYSAFLSGNLAETAKMLAAAVADGSYDGLFLDVRELTEKGVLLTNLVTALRTQLGTKLLYVAAEAPSWHQRNYNGYDYNALAKQADRLVLRMAPAERVDAAGQTLPVEPLEEVYYTLAQMNNKADMTKVSLMLTTTAAVWSNTKLIEVIPGTAVKTMEEAHGLTGYYAERYASPYLTGEVEEKTRMVWYLDSRAVKERVKLAACFGVDQICLSQLEGVSDEFIQGIQ